jgi:hypothetical protein
MYSFILDIINLYIESKLVLFISRFGLQALLVIISIKHKGVRLCVCVW